MIRLTLPAALLYLALGWLAYRALYHWLLARRWRSELADLSDVFGRRVRWSFSVTSSLRPLALRRLWEYAGEIATVLPAAAVVRRFFDEASRVTSDLAEVWVETAVERDLGAIVRRSANTACTATALAFVGTALGLVFATVEFASTGDQQSFFAGIGLALSTTLAGAVIALVERRTHDLVLVPMIESQAALAREMLARARAASFRVNGGGALCVAAGP